MALDSEAPGSASSAPPSPTPAILDLDPQDATRLNAFRAWLAPDPPINGLARDDIIREYIALTETLCARNQTLTTYAHDRFLEAQDLRSAKLDLQRQLACLRQRFNAFKCDAENREGLLRGLVPKEKLVLQMPASRRDEGKGEGEDEEKNGLVTMVEEFVGRVVEERTEISELNTRLSQEGEALRTEARRAAEERKGLERKVRRLETEVKEERARARRCDELAVQVEQNEKQLETLRQQQYPQPPQAQKPAQDHASPLVPVQIPPAVQSSPIRPPPQPTNPPAGPRLFPPLLHTALTALHLTATQSYTLLAALKALNQLTQPPLKAWRDMLQVYARVERVLAVAAEKDKQAGSETGRVRRVVSILDKNAVLGAAAGSGSASEDMLAGGGSELASVPAWLPSLLDKQAALARDKAEVERVASFREYVGEFDREAVEGWMGGGVGRDLDRADGQGKGGGWFGR